jgi:hypothetical protein
VAKFQLNSHYPHYIINKLMVTSALTHEFAIKSHQITIFDGYLQLNAISWRNIPKDWLVLPQNTRYPVASRKT